MKKILIILLLAVIAGIVYQASIDPSQNVSDEVPGTKTYSSSEFGLSFSYPSKYFLEEKAINTAQRLHHLIILTEDTEENRLVREGASPGREGPIAITVDVYQNDLDKMTARTFITGTSDSNYKLGPGNIATTTRGSAEGLEYAWSGLYEGKSFVVAKPRYIYMFSVTWLDPSDDILQDFDEMLQTLTITD